MRIPERINAPAPLPKGERVSVGVKLPGVAPRSTPVEDEWSAVVEELRPTPDGQWFVVGRVGSESEANAAVDRLEQHRGIQACPRLVDGVLTVFARRIVLSGRKT